jgi:hypothetical protein
MNIHKHMEAIVVGTLAVIGIGAIAVELLPDAVAKPAVSVERLVATPGHMAVVVVHGHRPAPR